MASAFNIDGKVVSIGDRVSIVGVVTAVGTGSDPNVTIQPPLSASTFVATAQDIRTVEGISNGGSQGNQVTVGNDCTTTGLVTAISGSGNTASLTVQLTQSGNSITVPAGACHSDNV
jgi:hypothetical protein